MSGFMGLTPVQVPDFGATLGRAQQYQQNQLLALAQARELQQGRALDAALNQYGEAAARGDTNALAAVARSGAQGARIAFPLVDQQQRRQMLAGLLGQGMPAGEPSMAAAAPAAPVAAAPAGDSSLPRGMRNNNPLNIEAGNFTQGQPGFAGSDGRFARFASMDAGIAAADRLLASYGEKGLNTPAAIIGRWAPAGDGNNNPQAYAAKVAQTLGVRPDEPLNMQDPAVRQRLISAMAQVENGRPLQAGGGSDAGPDFSAQLRQVDVLRRRAQAAALVGGESGKVLAEQLNQQANALERRIEAERVRADNPPPTVQLGAGPWGEAGVYERLRGGGYRRIGAVPPPTTLIQNQPESIRAAADRETLKAVTEGANQARTVLALFDRAEQAARRAPDGYGAQFAPIFGQVARTFGINMPGTSDAEVLQGLTTQLATLQRAPGSGATSDFEMGLYMRSVPQLGQTAQGRQQLIEMGRALARRKIEEARIWRQHAGEADLMDRLDALGPVFTEAQTKFLEGANAEPAQPAQGGIPGPGGMGTAEPPPPPQGFRVIR